MKTCPFCAEQIQAAATKCRHCGSDLARNEAEALDRQFEEASGWGIGIVFAVISLAIFGYMAYRSFVADDVQLAAIQAGFGVVGAIFCPAFSQIANKVRLATMPDVIIASNGAELAKAQLYWSVGPQSLASIFLIAGLFLAENHYFGRESEYVAQTPAQIANNPVGQKVSLRRGSDAGTVGTKQDEIVPIQQDFESGANLMSAKPDEAIDGEVDPAAKTDEPLIAVMLTSTAKSAASFDCIKASSKVEQMICSDDSLAEIDLRLARVYKAAYETASDKNALKASQNSWRKLGRDSCGDSACVMKQYESRISALTQ